MLLFVLDTPKHRGGKSSNGWQLTSSTGNLTPRVVLTQPPPLPATDHGKMEPLQRSDVRLDGSIIVPAAGHGRTGSHPVLAACCFSLLAGKNKPKTCIFFFGGVSLFSPGRSLRSRYLGFGLRQSSGNVPDEWVCSFQSSGRENKVPSALSTPLPLTHEGFWGFPLSLFVVKYSYV